MIFDHVGYLNAEQMKQVIDYYRTGWGKCAETGGNSRLDGGALGLVLKPVFQSLKTFCGG